MLTEETCLTCIGSCQQESSPRHHGAQQWLRAKDREGMQVVIYRLWKQINVWEFGENVSNLAGKKKTFPSVAARITMLGL